MMDLRVKSLPCSGENIGGPGLKKLKPGCPFGMNGVCIWLFIDSSCSQGGPSKSLTYSKFWLYG